MTPVRPGLGALLAVVAALTVAQSASAQSTEQIIGEARGEYDAAVLTHAAAQRALEVIDRRFYTAIFNGDRARSAGDGVRLADARSAAQALVGTLTDAMNRVAAAAGTVRSSRQLLIDLLILYQVELIELAEAAPSAAQRSDYDALLSDTSNELAELEGDLDDGSSLDPVARPDIFVDPRDGPDQILGKAQILERTAALLDTAVLAVDEEIAGLETRRDTERRQRDFMARARRFDDLNPPIGTPRRDPDVQSSDSTAAGGRPLTLDERIEVKRTYKQVLLDRRDAHLERARDFRARVRQRT